MPDAKVSGWTVDTLKEHTEALRNARDRLDLERDRRYTEVAREREKALKIKETADLAALELAREIQTYKDEKANDLRSQIERERGGYATKDELRPLADFVASQQGRSQGGLDARTLLISVLVLLGTFAAAISPHV